MRLEALAVSPVLLKAFWLTRTISTLGFRHEPVIWTMGVPCAHSVRWNGMVGVSYCPGRESDFALSGHFAICRVRVILAEGCSAIPPRTLIHV